MTIQQKLSALVKREFLDGKGGFFYTPLVIFAIIAGMGIISMIIGNDPVQIDDFSMREASEKWSSLGANQKEAAGYMVAGAYWVTSAALWIALPFVIFFSLLGSLYEDRRDKSILFWKSMPVSDALEVIVKFLTNTVMAVGIFLATAIVLQIVYAVLLSIWFGFQGAPISVFWPLAQMIEGWVTAIPVFFLFFLWAAPTLAWLILVSAYAKRMPFMYAVVPVVVIVILEATMFKGTGFIEMIVQHIAVGFGESVEAAGKAVDHMGIGRPDFDNEEGAANLVSLINSASVVDMYAYALSKLNFWMGLLVAGGFIYGAIELRKRAS